MLEQYGYQIIEQLTKHVHTRTVFVKEYQEEGKILSKFVTSEDNDADINTKNTANVIFWKHQEKIVWHKNEISDEKDI